MGLKTILVCAIIALTLVSCVTGEDAKSASSANAAVDAAVVAPPNPAAQELIDAYVDAMSRYDPDAGDGADEGMFDASHPLHPPLSRVARAQRSARAVTHPPARPDSTCTHYLHTTLTVTQ
jgi:hypothetical protein